MVTPPNQTALGLDRTTVRLTVLGLLVVGAFTALFSRLWFLQVLAAEEYVRLAEETRARLVHSEPPRGRILDARGRVLVQNRRSLSVTIDKQMLDERGEQRPVLAALSRLLDAGVNDLRKELNDGSASPYKPVPVANDIPEEAAIYITEHSEDFPGVGIENLWLREYPHGSVGAHVLGYVREINTDELELPYFADARPGYRPGDMIGKAGVERTYDRWLRGTPSVTRVIVNSSNKVISSDVVRPERPGSDLVLSLDLDVQRTAERALQESLEAARAAGYQAPAGAVVVLDPSTGAVVAMASRPTYNPSIIADGFTTKENDSLGASTPNNPDDDALLNRAIQAQRPPGSTFKIVTAGAAMALGIASTGTHLDCPPSKTYPPGGGPGSQTFNNWTSAHKGVLDFAQSLEQSCDTFYYELGWRMQQAYGAVTGDGSERFQSYARRAGLGRRTGIDLSYEAPGRIPDEKWCKQMYEATKDNPFPTCEFGWLPGFTVNMSIGQGDVVTTPLQMAVTLAAVADDGAVRRPRLGWRLEDPAAADEPVVVKKFRARTVRRLPLDPPELDVIRRGLVDVVSGAEGTATYAFSGFPLDRVPIAGKTGTAQLRSGDTPLNDAWFVSYAPADRPRYVASVYIEKAGHGGESAAPVARQIWEAIFDVDRETDVQLGRDFSG